MKKKQIIAVVFIVVALVTFWFFYVPPSWQRVIGRCTNYNPQWLGMLDCYGVISIWQPDDSGYMILNNINRGLIVAEIEQVDSFIIYNDQMYLIDITPQGVCDNLMPGKYCGSFQTDGESRTYYYNTPNEVPKYLIIDTKTGDEKFYVRPQDASSDNAAIFQELIKKENARPWYQKFWDRI